MLSTYMFRELQPQIQQPVSAVLDERGGTLQQRQAMSGRSRKRSSPYTDYRNI